MFSVYSIFNVESEFIPFATFFLILAVGVHFLLRRYWKARSLRLSLVIIGLFWVLFGYMQFKFSTFCRIWAVIDAPYNLLALQEFFSYDVLPILALLLTGSSFVLYSSVLTMNPGRTPLKWFVKGILYFLILIGCFMATYTFIATYYEIMICGSFQVFHQKYASLDIYYWRAHLAPLFMIYTGFCFLELLRRAENMGVGHAGIHYRKNKMALLPIAGLVWISAGIVNFVSTIIPLLENRVFYSWAWRASMIDKAIGIAATFALEQLFYMLIGFLLLIIWVWGSRSERKNG